MSVNTKENIETIFGKLENFFKSKTVVGEPIKVGETTIIPFVDISFGLGAGGGDGKDDEGNDGSGSGAGAGGRISATAVLVIKGDQVELLPIKKAGGFERLLDMVPEIVEKVKEKEDDDND